jgi:hypothetical protein
VEIMGQALEDALNAREHSAVARQQRVRLFATHGEASIKARNELARTFREHNGGCILTATMDSMPEAISLLSEVEEHPAATEHFGQMHFLPGPMFQAENRMYHKDIKGLTIFTYIANKTIDERVERRVRPRIETMDKLAADTDAAGALKALMKKEESLREVWDRLFKDMPSDGRVSFGSASDDASDD